VIAKLKCGAQSLAFSEKDNAMTVSSWFSKMVGTSMTLNNLENVLVLQLRDLASAEEQLVEALPKMADAAACSHLKNAFLTHLEETRRQRDRLDRVFELLGIETQTDTSEAMQALIAEGNEVIGLEGEPEVKDVALIAAAQRVEHYEIAGYGCARTFAQQLGHAEIAELLQETLDEEGDADKKLTRIAESHFNAMTSHL
jgi:ferritin-like metal-binding protein YciE